MRLPIYNAFLDDMEDGIFAIALVESPAVQSDFFAFENEEKETLEFSSIDDEQHMIMGVVCRAEYPMLRKSDKLGKFYLKMSKETIKCMAEKMFADGSYNNIKLTHQQGTETQGVRLVQCFIKDEAMGISPKGFEDIEDGSLFAVFKCEDESIWQDVKSGKFKGFSIEANMFVKQEEDADINEIMSIISKILKK